MNNIRQVTKQGEKMFAGLIAPGYF